MKNLRILSQEEIKEIKTEINSKKSVNTKKLNSNFISERDRVLILNNIKTIEKLEDEILINKALGLINLDFCIDNNIEFGDLAKAINRQRK
jgi:hypothetical protein